MKSLESSPTTDLRNAFGVFTEAAKELEEAYEKLRLKGKEIDRELREVNRELRSKVRELDDLSCYLEGLLQALPTGVLAVGKDGRVTLVNGAAEEILGVDKEELVGKDRGEFAGPRGPLLDEAEGVEQDQAADRWTERDIVNFRGEHRKIEGRLIELRNPQGEFQGKIEILDDRTEVVRLRERIHRLDRLAGLGEMAAGMAHEIRNPLYGSAGFADLLERELKKEPETERLVPYVARIRKGIQRVDAIIDSVLSFSRPQSWRSARVDLVKVLEDAIETVLQGPTSPDLARLEVQLPEEPCWAEVDATKLERVFENLLRNAAESTEMAGEIEIEAVLDDSDGVDREWFRVRISDRGWGIDPEVQARIFDPFFTTKESGAGLGLFFVQRILEVYEGGLELTNRAGGGASARLHIPLVVSQEVGARTEALGEEAKA